MKILLVGAEAAPYAQVGGLSQVVHFLGRAMVAKGHDVRLFLPKYGTIQERRFPLTTVHKDLRVPTGHAATRGPHPASLICNIKQHQKLGWPTAYFLENQEYYELRANVYGYVDEHIRFFLLSRGVLEWLRLQHQQGGWLPDILHCNDWHTGYLVDEARRNRRYRAALAGTAIVFQIHNLQYQGNYDFRYLKDHQRDTGLPRLKPFFHRRLAAQNSMLRGILYADHVLTVSNAYAQEIQTKQYGFHLEKALRRRRAHLSGILNGIDTTEFNPETDTRLAARFSVRSLYRRRTNKEWLQRKFGLPVDETIPVLTYLGRLASQKGVDLIVRLIPKVLQHQNAQFIFAGTGDEQSHRQIEGLVQQYPRNVAAYLFSDFALPRRLFAGSDMILVPSRFEPAGIVPMEAMRYGAVPIASATGGLTESITPFDPKTSHGTGFLFKPNDLWSLFAAVVQAIQMYRLDDYWQRLVTSGLESDFSWHHAATQYLELYERLRRRSNGTG